MYTIMLVEDDEKLRTLTSQALIRWGFNVVTATQWEQIDQTFIAEKPHLVLMDVNLPAFDGFYWCRKLREDSRVPILFLSSRGEGMDAVMAMSMGGDDYVTKPFVMEVLVAKINALLRRAYDYNAQGGGIVACGNVILSDADNTLRHGEARLLLTRNEYRILHTLMQKAGQIISREELMRALWEDEHFVDDNTLTVNVNRLRKKIADIGLENWIKTIKNQGYTLS